MSTNLNSLLYQTVPDAKARFENGKVVLEKAYSLNGKFYDITYETNQVTIQKLQKMEPEKLIKTLQDQMKAFLTASEALVAPEKTSFQLSAKKVYAKTEDKKRYSISEKVDFSTNKNMGEIVRTFHESVELAGRDLADAADLEEEGDSAENPIKKGILGGVIDSARITTGAVSKLNLLAYGPVPTLSPVTGAATLASGVIGVGQNGYQAYSNFKAGETADGIESIVKAAGAGAEVVSGVVALSTGPSTMGAIAYSIAVGSNLLINLKDLILFISTDKPLPPNFWWSFLSNTTMFIGSILVLAGVFSNPFTALAVLGGLALLALVGFIIANKDTVQEILSKMEWWETILFIAPIVISIGISAAGVPHATWIGLGVSAGTFLLNLAGNKFLKNPPQPELPPKQEAETVGEQQIA